MRDFSIDLIWAKIQVAITAIGGWIGWFLGGVDGMLIALIVLMALDYLSGVMCAIVDKKLSSAIGFKGICKKVLILMLVGVANIIDVHVVGTGAVLRGPLRGVTGLFRIDPLMDEFSGDGGVVFAPQLLSVYQIALALAERKMLDRRKLDRLVRKLVHDVPSFPVRSLR